MSEQTEAVSKNLFDELGLEVKQGEVKIGETYPIFGMITRLVDERPGHVVAEINYSILAKMNIPDLKKLQVLKERAFETGIFISEVTSIEPDLQVECKTVIFGKRQSYNA